MNGRVVAIKRSSHGFVVKGRKDGGNRPEGRLDPSQRGQSRKQRYRKRQEVHLTGKLRPRVAPRHISGRNSAGDDATDGADENVGEKRVRGCASRRFHDYAEPWIPVARISRPLKLARGHQRVP